MGKYDRQIATAKRLIKKYGSPVTFRQVRDAVSDPAKPWDDLPAVTIDKTVDAVFVDDSSTLQQVFAAYLSGTVIPDGQVTVFLPDFGLQPSNKDVIIKDGVEYRIAKVGTLKPADQIIMHSLGVIG
ncbi:head-to-tail stopper [Erwinia phage AH03]|uniref:Head-to-tail stopper n=1 Tax=Erwinia phage AH03 TaxID=2869568 RepID=A0AAE8BQS2_9CAUD|nr:head-to-tail stopper [Erwinia phage AH03]